MNYVFSTEKTKRYRFPTHINDLVMDRSEATASEVFVVVLAPGEAPPLHRHDDTEQIFYVLGGRGQLTVGPSRQQHPVAPGDVVRIPPETLHSIECLGNQPLTYLAVDCFPGGRPNAEPTWDAHVQTMCRQQGWDYNQVTAD
ncbi:MAG: cupin domain-containing protein [Chloroflexi bacterium]|nr:MAG: cupin domain-containing protein [Chloroflexota bacterium]